MKHNYPFIECISDLLQTIPIICKNGYFQFARMRQLENPKTSNIIDESFSFFSDMPNIRATQLKKREKMQYTRANIK
jgi:hypothetical protein